MKNLVLTAVAAVALVASAPSTFAAATQTQQERTQTKQDEDSSSNLNNNCASILANRAAHSAKDVKFLEVAVVAGRLATLRK